MRLQNWKGGEGHREQVRYVAIPDSLLEMLKRWQEERPCKSAETVFFQHHNDTKTGQPFTHRSHWIPDLCKKVGVKKFTLHSIRHKAASVIFTENGLVDAQLLMGHKKATTTDRYVRSSGWYRPKEGIADALENSEIARAMGFFDQKKAPSEVSASDGESNRGPVTNGVHTAKAT